MPQEFHVLQCYSCKMFQVDIVKKSTKWSCKMCGEKQSMKKIFGRGNGKDCRLHVQELNERRIKSEIEISFEQKPEVSYQDMCMDENNLEVYSSSSKPIRNPKDSENIVSLPYFIQKGKLEKHTNICKQEYGKPKKKSKWDDYMQDNELDNLENTKLPYKQSLHISVNIASKMPKNDEIDKCKNIIKIEENIDLEAYQLTETKDAINGEEIIPAFKVSVAKNLCFNQQTGIENNVEDKKMCIPKKMKLCNYNRDSKNGEKQYSFKENLISKLSKQEGQESKKRYSRSNMFQSEDSEDLDYLLQI